VAEIRLSRLLVVLERLTQHEFIVATSERTTEQCDWTQVDIGIGTFRLTSAGSIEVPLGQFFSGLWNEIQRSRLATHRLTSAVNPDIHDLDLLVRLWKRQIMLSNLFVQRCVRHLESAQCLDTNLQTTSNITMQTTDSDHFYRCH